MFYIAFKTKKKYTGKGNIEKHKFYVTYEDKLTKISHGKFIVFLFFRNVYETENNLNTAVWKLFLLKKPMVKQKEKKVQKT